MRRVSSRSSGLIGGRPPAQDTRGESLAGRALTMESLFMAYHGYSGMITLPMLELARRPIRSRSTCRSTAIR